MKRGLHIEGTTLQRPDPDPDGDAATADTVHAYALGKPGGAAGASNASPGHVATPARGPIVARAASGRETGARSCDGDVLRLGGSSSAAGVCAQDLALWFG